MTDATNNAPRPRAQSLPSGYVLESPADRLDDVMSKHERAGTMPGWNREPKSEGYASWNRQLGDYLLRVTIEHDGWAAIDVSGPHGGREVKAHEFAPEILHRATAGLPTWAQPRVKASVDAFARSAQVQRPDVNSEPLPTTARPGFWERMLGRSDADAMATAKAYTEERAAYVRKALTDGRKKLLDVEMSLPEGESFAHYRETSEQLRRTLAQALTAAEYNPTFLQVVRSNYAKDVEILALSLTGLSASGDLAQRVGIATTLEQSLRSMNDALVRDLGSVVNNEALRHMAGAAVATGSTSVGGILDHARTVSTGERQAVTGSVANVLQIRIDGGGDRVTAASLRALCERDETGKFLCEFLKDLTAFINDGNAAWLTVFPDGAGGPVELAMHAGGFAWVGPNGAANVTDAQVAGITRQGLQSALEEIADRITEGLRAYFPGEVTAQTPRGELAARFDQEVKRPDMARLQAAMAAGGFPL